MLASKGFGETAEDLREVDRWCTPGPVDRVWRGYAVGSIEGGGAEELEGGDVDLHVGRAEVEMWVARCTQRLPRSGLVQQGVGADRPRGPLNADPLGARPD